MSKVYKIHLSIEEVEHETDHYQEVSDPIEIAEITSLEKAEEIVGRLESYGYALTDPVNLDTRFVPLVVTVVVSDGGVCMVDTPRGVKVVVSDEDNQRASEFVNVNYTVQEFEVDYPIEEDSN